MGGSEGTLFPGRKRSKRIRLPPAVRADESERTQYADLSDAFDSLLVHAPDVGR